MNNLCDLVFIFGAQYLYLFVVIIAFAWFLRQPGFKQKEILIILCICLPLIYFASRVASHLYYNPRPFVSGRFLPLIPHKADNSFPSHHLLLVSAIAAVIFIFNRRISYLLWGMALFIGISRIYIGVHHLMDIVASILLAIIAVAAVYFIKLYFKKIASR